jgi:L-ascorbate metabolism protein UlaG (beta-lactamase superfamily)
MNAGVRLEWLGQSGFLIGIGGANVLVDAFLAPHPDRRFASSLPEGASRALDVIACTHEHLDHLDRDCVPELCASSPGAQVVVPEPIVDVVVALGISRDRVIGMQSHDPAEVGGITIHALPAMHGVHPADAYSFGREVSGGMDRFLGFVFEGGGVRVYHAGDTIPYDGLGQRLRELRVDIALLPINGRDATREALDIVGNMDADEAAVLAIQAEVDVAIPMHYDMFAANPGDPARMVAAVERLGGGVNVVVPARGRPFVYTRP